MINTFFSRRDFLQSMIVGGGLIHFQKNQAVTLNRKSIVSRHDPVITKIDKTSPLSIGNGEFAFTADVTGLQTFSEVYENSMPLCTMSQWGWHTLPLANQHEPNAIHLTQYETYGRMVGYATKSEGQSELFNWLRQNPHRLHLGRIGLNLTMPDGSKAKPEDIYEIEQRLDLWNGILISKFKISNIPVTVKTCVHPQKDQLAVLIESPLINSNRLAVNITFPYGSPNMNAAEWREPQRHTTTHEYLDKKTIRLNRKLNSDEYYSIVHLHSEAEFISVDKHSYSIAPKNNKLVFTITFTKSHESIPFEAITSIFGKSSQYWNHFWVKGGAVDLSNSIDSRASELERRIILSQYLTAIQCSGSQPPQETGLTVNSWYGKFHLEMHWWHAAHFALWNRIHLLEKSLSWYESILPVAENLARSQGYKGARWPKMVGPEGRDSPSPIGPLLIWQQPHPIFYAELCFKAHKDRTTLKRFEDIVFMSAEFMASYTHYDSKNRRYILGPPLIPAQENHPPLETWNPTFELEYWRFGLEIAQQWRERLGMKRNPQWDNVINKISPPPIANGVYLAHENCPQTFTERNIDHPSMLGAMGVLPGKLINKEIMRNTLFKAMKEWQWDKTWGWDFPMTAMTAARLGEKDIAIDALLMKADKNKYLPNGHNYQRPNLPCYLPGNGGLLYAIAMMTAGTEGAKQSSAFPLNWNVKWEGINKAM